MLAEYLTKKELAEAVEVMERNKAAWIDFCEACNFTPSVDDIIAWLVGHDGFMWLCRYENSKLIRNTINQINQLPQAASSQTCEAGQTKTL